MSEGKGKARGGRVRRMFGRRFAAGGYAALASALVIAIAVAVNLVVGALPESKTQIDLTDQAIYTLSDQTRRIAEALDKDVTLTLLASKGGEDATVERLLSRYAELSGHIKTAHVDPTERPTFLDAYELDLSHLYANSVLVECGERYKLVGYDEIFVTSYSMDYQTYGYQTSTSFDGENALTNAIHYVSSDDVPVIYTLTGHGEAGMSETLSAMVERDNLQSESLSLLTLDAVPEDAAAVVILAPQSDLSAEEADRLIAYVQSGGGVLLTTDYIEAGEMTNLLRVTQAMGLTAGTGIVVEGDPGKHVSRYPYYLLPDIASHEITDPLIDGGYYALLPLAQPIEQTEDAQASVTWLLTTSESAYAKAAGLAMTTTEREDGDTDGPFHVAAAAELGEGKLLWVPSADVTQDTVNALVAGANGDLLLNGLEWMCGQRETISIRAKSLDQSGLTLTSAQSRFWSFVFIGVLPLAFIAAGAAVVVRRKRR